MTPHELAGWIIVGLVLATLAASFYNVARHKKKPPSTGTVLGLVVLLLVGSQLSGYDAVDRLVGYVERLAAVIPN